MVNLAEEVTDDSDDGTSSDKEEEAPGLQHAQRPRRSKTRVQPSLSLHLRPQTQEVVQQRLAMVANVVLSTRSKAMELDKAELWKDFIQDELDSLPRNQTWILVGKPANANLINCK